ncbi:MAG: MBL fold metallo-hydrolase [Clostridia bacterium]|nr:MBL fold metallo-hydrolase [Clostridia bacterium]
MNRLLNTVYTTPTPFGTAALWWLGQMGLIVKAGNTVVCIDYYAAPEPRRQTKPPIPAEELEGMNAILGTHDHLDHIDHESWRIWAKTCPEAMFVFPAAHRNAVLADGVAPQNARGLNDGESLKVGDLTIRAVAAAHEFLARDPETGLYPCLQYMIEGNGVRIYHAGDTLRYEGMLPRLQSFGRIDAALLPINGRDGVRYRRNCIGNMTFQEAADLAGEFGVGCVLPGHWDMFADNSADPAAFADYLDAKYPGRMACIIPEVMKPVMISGSLSENK